MIEHIDDLNLEINANNLSNIIITSLQYKIKV